MVGWSESGLYVANMLNILTGAIVENWNLTSNKIALYNNTETPDFTQVAASAIYSATNEVSGTGWAAGGPTVLTAAVGASSMAPTLTQSPVKSVMANFTNALSVATTTLAAAYGAKIYCDSLSPKAALIGVYFGGAGYSTTAGTFAITWAALGVYVIKCVPSGA